MGLMDATRVALLREVLASTGWVESTRSFARALCGATREPGGLLLVGTPDDEPWHLAAHLDDESRWNDRPALAPTLVRWAPPEGAPAHLRVGVDRIARARRGETLFVVTPQTPPLPLLERTADARRDGATVFTIDGGDRDLEDLAHEALTVPTTEEVVSFEAVQHLVSSAAGQPAVRASRPGIRTRLARLLDTVTGPGLPE